MKKLIGYVASWVLYYLGHWTSMPVNTFDVFWLYGIYNWFMVTSHDIQEWSMIDNGPWTEGKGIEE